jgi:hypothetical protein
MPATAAVWKMTAVPPRSIKSRSLRNPPYRFHAQARIGGYKIMFKKTMKTNRGSSLVLSAMLPVAINPTITDVAK